MKTNTLLLGLALTIAVGAAAPSASTNSDHFGLSKSSPTADAAVPSPEEVRLWFTQAPQDNSVRIRLVDAAGDPLDLGDAVRDAEDATVFTLSVQTVLAPGAYTVAWRGIGDDGHVVDGDFAFSVTAH